MPAYNFKREFAPAVESGQKRQTIRKKRKRPTRVGETLYLYTGMRTKGCRKLKETTCTASEPIYIDINHIFVGEHELNRGEEIQLAKDDGFDSHAAFMQFFENHYGLPFKGVLIKW